jgi:hypothetical protein
MLSKEDKRKYRWHLLGQAIKSHLEDDRELEWALSGHHMEMVLLAINEFFEEQEIAAEIFFDDET